MSGQNRLINSDNTANGNNLASLKEKLMDANAVAAEITNSGMKYKVEGESGTGDSSQEDE